jgi:hypothetical protein
LTEDRVLTVFLEEGELGCSRSNGDAIAGPVPTLFEANLQVSRHDKRIFQDLSRIYRKFCIAQNITASIALDVVCKIS